MAKTWAAGDQITAADLNAAVSPTGAILIWATATPPTNWVLCDGASLLRAGTYADLFAVIGTAYGAADGSHFNVPNLKGKIPVGFNASENEFDALGETGGEKTHQLTVAELAAHHHDTNVFTSNTGSVGALPSQAAAANQIVSGDTGSNTAHNNLQPYIALNYIIKY